MQILCLTWHAYRIAFPEKPSVAYLDSADRPRLVTHVPYRAPMGLAETAISEKELAVDPFAECSDLGV